MPSMPHCRLRCRGDNNSGRLNARMTDDQRVDHALHVDRVASKQIAVTVGERHQRQ